jgi:hypothetical protein
VHRFANDALRLPPDRNPVNEDKSMKHYLLLALLLAAALVCYFVGLVDGSIAFFCIGALLELNFWFRLFKRRHRPAGAV